MSVQEHQHGGAAQDLRQMPASVDIAQFFVPASASLQERRPRTLKHGDTFGVYDHNGDAIAGPNSPEGLYYRDTRHLSHLFTTLDGHRPLLLSSTLRDDNASLTCDLTNPDLPRDAAAPDYEEPPGVLQHDLIHIRRTRFLWKCSALERLAVHNYDTTAHQIRLGIAFAADFADIFEVRGSVRAARGTAADPVVGKDRVELAYHGLDGQAYRTVLRFDPVPDRLTATDASFDLTLAPGASLSIFLDVACGSNPDCGPPRRTFLAGLRDARRDLRQASSQAASLESSNNLFNELVRRSVSDLYMLATQTAEGRYPYAGVPWFSTVFGRDALITAHQTLWLDPSITRGVLMHLAAHQATRTDPEADAEPGKIIHEMRFGEMARLREVPFGNYYGSVDSTPLFVMLAGAYLVRTGDLESLRSIWPNLQAALEWIRDYGDRDGDGFVEYGRRTGEGLINQGWKDSHDSISHADGTLARGPVAVVEVQAYAYAAWQAGAAIARQLGKDALAADYITRATALRDAFAEAFFDAELGTFVLALDGDKRPCRVRSSNAGHALFAGIARPEHAACVARSLMDASFFSGWGVRTLPLGEVRYNPMSYHNGSVWPHDNAIIAAGLARYGFRQEAGRIFEGLFEASNHIDLRRLPELFCGFRRQRSQGPTFYPVACTPQAWAAGSVLSMVQSCLGLDFDADHGHVIFNEPVLPGFIGDLVLRGITLPQGQVDVALSRVRAEVAAHVLRRSGEARVLTRA